MMNEEETISSDTKQRPDPMKTTIASDDSQALDGETEVVSPISDLADASMVEEDEMIVLLEDTDGPDLLSTCPGEDLHPCDLDELPEMSAELVDDLPEVEDVEDITSLVEGAKRRSKVKPSPWKIDNFDQFKELAIEHWRPGAAAAALLIALILAASSFWSGLGSTVTAADEFSKTAIAAGQFEEWVVETIDQHMVGTGMEK
ncbi:MAG: hypothetical protein AAEJ47_07410 [Planctomycetota bacterium]